MPHLCVSFWTICLLQWLTMDPCSHSQNHFTGIWLSIFYTSLCISNSRTFFLLYSVTKKKKISEPLRKIKKIVYLVQLLIFTINENGSQRKRKLGKKWLKTLTNCKKAGVWLNWKFELTLSMLCLYDCFFSQKCKQKQCIKHLSLLLLTYKLTSSFLQL